MGRIASRRLVLALVVSIGLLTTSCNSGSDLLETVTGTVVNTETGDPIVDATIMAGQKETTTDGEGEFVLKDVAVGSELSAEACGHEAARETLGEDAGQRLRLELQAIPIEGTVRSNLTDEPIPSARVQAASVTGKSNKAGRFVLKGICSGTNLRIAAKGYEKEATSVEKVDRDIEVVLAAGPGETLKQMTRWESQQQWGKEWELVHPDARSYIKRSEWIRVAKESVAEGSQGIREVIKSVDMIRWTFPACQFADFGPKTYKRTAAVSAVKYESTPAGGQTKYEHLSHLVRTKDGLWRWFPVAGCDYQI